MILLNIIRHGHSNEVSKDALTENPGLTRYWLAEKDDPACASFYKVYDSETDRRDMWERNGKTYNPDLCVGSQSISNISAEYSTWGFARFTKEKHGPVTLIAGKFLLNRGENDAEVASLMVVRQRTWMEKLFFVPLLPSPQCPGLLGERDGVSFDSLPLSFLFEKIRNFKK